MPERRIAEYKMVDVTYAGDSASVKLQEGWCLHGFPIVTRRVQTVVTGRDHDTLSEEGVTQVMQAVIRYDDMKSAFEVKQQAQDLLVSLERRATELDLRAKEIEVTHNVLLSATTPNITDEDIPF